MAKGKDDPAELRKGERVVATIDLREVPAGTAGKVTTVHGLSWIRYWVRFDNGVTMGSIHRQKLAREGQWDPETAAREAAEREQAAAAAEQAGAESTPDAADGDAPTDTPKSEAPKSEAPKSEAASKVPAHLLERARKAREKAAG
ncbi:hypothetical protein BH20ACT2_BH20ACT2_12160 [soil metagenome]